jgi:Ca2+-binding RTX toxin-like protein
MMGNPGNNVLNGGAGADTLIGGLGNDTYLVDDIGDVIIEQLASGTDIVQSSISYTLSNNLENLLLIGSAAMDGIGNPLNNTITGNAGNNSIDGGAGKDKLAGGAGDDTYVVDNTGDVVTEGINAGIDTVQSSVTSTLGANLENLKLTGSTAIHGTGNVLSNTITGNSGNNVLNGGAGADTLIGGLGNDTYVIDDVGDVIIEEIGSGSDTIQSSISYTLGANLENLSLTGLASIDGTGNTFNNTITGNAGNNSIDGGTGADKMAGGAGDDTYIVDNIGDVITEALNAGIDSVQSSTTFTLGANLENLTLTGSSAINGTGNALHNIITGNAGNNILRGGTGIDILTGLESADNFQFALADSRLNAFDRITDLAIGTDSIDGPSIVSAANLMHFGSVSSLTQEGIAASLTPSTFLKNQAATFTFGASTYLALNDAVHGFNSGTDGIIEITGYSGDIYSLAII